MSIDKVEVTNSRGDLQTFMLEDVSNGYVVKEILGLDPVKASIVSSSFATMDGQQYQSSSRETRNIIIKLGYAPNYTENETIRSLRSRLYLFFMSASEISLKFFMTDGLVVNTTGRVESCEAPLFTKEPETDISIICFDPDFIDEDLVEIHDTFVTTDTTSQTIDVAGTIETGLLSLSFVPNKSLDGFTIYHTSPAGVLYTMLVEVPLILNDVVTLCTVKGQKSITLLRSGVTTSLLWAVSPQSTWIQLEPGLNEFYMNADDTDGSPILLDYRNRYGGL